MASMEEMTCKCGCERTRLVRKADVKRGWGRFYSKSCKARYQERKTGQCKAYYRRREARENGDGEYFTGQFTDGCEMGHGEGPN